MMTEKIKTTEDCGFDRLVERYGTNSKKWDECEARFGRKGLIPMWIADMDFMVPEEILRAFEHRISQGIFGYNTTPDSYSMAIVNWMERRHSWKVQKDWICHSPGIVSALSFLLDTYTRKGDKVVIQSPVYYPFENCIRMSERIVVNNPLKESNGKFTMDLNDLKEKIDSETRMIFLCSPHNPVGRVWTKTELAEFAEICLSRNLIVVADEVHSDLIYKGFSQTCFATISESIAQRSVICSGASKTFNLAGLKTSNVIIPNDDLREKFINTLTRYNVCSGNTFGLMATEVAYNQGEYWLDRLIEYIQGNLEYASKFFEEKIPNVRLIRPQGTYLLWLDFRRLGLNDRELANFCLQEAKIALDPGVEFGAEGSGYMRMNIACRRSLLVEALERLKEAVEKKK